MSFVVENDDHREVSRAGIGAGFFSRPCRRHRSVADHGYDIVLAAGEGFARAPHAQRRGDRVEEWAAPTDRNRLSGALRETGQSAACAHRAGMLSRRPSDLGRISWWPTSPISHAIPRGSKYIQAVVNSTTPRPRRQMSTLSRTGIRWFPDAIHRRLAGLFHLEPARSRGVDGGRNRAFC